MNSWEAFGDAEGNPRDSISTFDSDFSLAASSIFSTGRPSSFASSHTAYSSLSSPSLRSCYSPKITDSKYAGSSITDPSSVYGRGLVGFSPTTSQPRANDRQALLRAALLANGTPIDDPYAAALRTETAVRTPSSSSPPISVKEFKSTSAEKKLHNRFACPSCDRTFSKRSDRKSHWKESCQYTSDKPDGQDSKPSLVCPSCNHIARNKHQVGQHQRTHGHIRGTWDAIRLCDKPRFTCSDDGIIYRTAEEFFAHFKNNTCKLNQHEKHGRWFHDSRLITLMQEGRDDRGGQHYGTYARLLIHCSRHDMTERDWRSIIASHSEQVAQQFAERLEWGIALPPLSPAMMRLGFTDLEQMVASIVPPPRHSLTVSRLSGTARSASTADSARQHISSQLHRQQPQTSQNSPHYYSDTSVEAGSTSAVATSRAEGPFNRNRSAESGASPEDWESKWNPSSMSQAALMAPPTWSAVNDSPRSFKIALSSERTCFENDYHDDLDSEPWLNLTETFVTQDMLLERTTQSGFPGRTSCRRSNKASSLPQRDKSIYIQPDGSVVANTTDTFTRSADNTICPAHNEPSPPASAPKAKRPISKTSEIHPESVVRSQRQHRLPFRMSSGDSKPHRSSQSHSAGLPSHRESSESTGFFFDYLKYDQDDIHEVRQISTHEQSPPRVSPKPVSIIQGVLVPTPSEHFVDSSRRSSVPDRPKTTLKEKIKACAKKSFTTQITELEDGDFLSRPPSGATKAVVPGQCVYCGIVNDAECLSGHISEVRVRRKHQGTVFEEADLRDLHDLFDFDELRSFGNSDYDQLSKSL